MSDIFREVDEDLRREQYKRLWDRFGPYVIGLAVLIVVATAGYRFWEYWQDRQAAASGDRFIAALQLSEAGDHEQAAAALAELAQNGSGGYPLLAQFRAAGEKAAMGDTQGAVAEYDAVAESGGAPPLIADMARLRAALILSDSASAAELGTRIGDLAQSGNRWRHSAREILGLAAWREGDMTAARDYFDQLDADQETPPDVRGRAQFMLSLITAQEGPPPEDPAEG